jgi:hypothetical protein
MRPSRDDKEGTLSNPQCFVFSNCCSHTMTGFLDRLRVRMQSRSSRTKPWLAKSPSVSGTSSFSNRGASAGDRSHVAADILNEDRVALAARLRDPGDDPPPNYFRDSTAADDEPFASPSSFLSCICIMLICLPDSTCPAPSAANQALKTPIMMSGMLSVSASLRSGGKYALFKRLASF